MPQTYYCLLTKIGEAKDANAKALGTAMKITDMAVGDGNGVLPVPDPGRDRLVRQVRRAPLNSLSRDPVNQNQVIAEQVLPENVGGWWIRELGLYDQDGDLVAIGNCPESYKPQLAEGSGRVQVVRMVLIMSSAATVELKIDPSVVLATRKYVDDQDALKAPIVSPAFLGTPTALTPPRFDASTRLATMEALKRQGMQASSLITLNANTVLTEEAAGATVINVATAPTTWTLPDVTTLPAGVRIELANFSSDSAGVVTVLKSPANNNNYPLLPGVANWSNPIILKRGHTLILEANGGQTWLAVGGNSAIVTPAQFANDLQVVNAEFVQRALGNMQSWSNVAHNATMPAAKAGGLFGSEAGGANTHYLPMLSSVPIGAAFTYLNTAGDVTTIQRGGAPDSISVDGVPLTAYQVLTGQSATFVKATAATWLVTSAGIGRGPAYRGFNGPGANYTLLPKDIGTSVWFSGSNVTLTAPTPTSLGAKTGDVVNVFSGAQTGNKIVPGAGATINDVNWGGVGQVDIKQGQGLVLLAVNATTWQVINSTASLKQNADFAASLSSYGYQKLPSGLILQWGYITTSATGDVMLSFPIAFPNGVLSVLATYQNDTGSNPVVAAIGAVVATGCGVGGFNPSTNARVGAQIRVLVIGY